MAQSYLVFDFGSNEEAAQQARHRIEGWKQAFRLGKRLEFKFERKPNEKTEKPEAGQAAKKKADEGKNLDERVRLLVRLDFSAHEKMTFHRWLERIPAEQPFKSVASQVIRHSEPEFSKTAELFDLLS